MSGLRRIAKLCGGIKVQGVQYVWDYAADKPVLESEMPLGSDRHKASERIRWLGARNKLQCQARGCDGCSVCKPLESSGNES